MLIPLGSSSYNYSGYIYATATPSTGTPNVYSEPNKGFFSPTSAAQEKELMKKIALFVSLLNLLVSIYMWFQFDNSSANYQFVYEFNSLNFCHFHVGVDGISLYFVLLTTFITPICILSNWTDITVNLNFF